MTFEEIKEMFKKSIDATDTMNQAIENLIQSIYLKGYNDALNTVEVGSKEIQVYNKGFEDCRQAVLALAKEECDTAIIPYRKFVKDINALPPATPQPKIGHWREVDTNMYACSNCNHCFSIVLEDNSIKQYHYCPNCGARMEREG